ncbi:hypothetical protein PENTCL1PPCAC_1410, partial [Pristionchus entomophagus]
HVRCEITCDSRFFLKMKFGNEDWKEVGFARADSNNFKGMLMDGTDFSESSVQLKCVRMKCTFCENPCPKCPLKLSSKFTPSYVWDDCAKFT